VELTSSPISQSYSIQEEDLLIRMNALLALNLLFDIMQCIVTSVNKEMNETACQDLNVNLYVE